MGAGSQNTGRDARATRLIVLGSTGSIGTQTLEVVEHLNGLHARGVWPIRYEVVGLAAGRNQSLLHSQASRFGVRETALGSPPALAGSEVYALETCESSLTGELRFRARDGVSAAEMLVREVECDLVVAAMSGAAGLPATLAAVEMGRDVALANKETLVAAGAIVVEAARKSGARLLPVDSEHSGVWQCVESETARQRDSETGGRAAGGLWR